MIRTRFIIMPTQGDGRPCPTELTQQKTCPVTPCYSWVLSNWSACKLEVGHGMTEKCFSVCPKHLSSQTYVLMEQISQCQGPGTVYFYVMENMEKRTKWLNLIQSDIARKINSRSLGTIYNKLGQGTSNLFGILRNSLSSWLVGNIKALCN